jgi:hypothetical protein
MNVRGSCAYTCMLKNFPAYLPDKRKKRQCKIATANIRGNGKIKGKFWLGSVS